MDIVRHILEALSNLNKSKLRSFLAILGILVGTGSVVALITSTRLATEHALAQFKTLGTNILAIDIRQQDGEGQSQQTAQLKVSDIAKIKAASPSIEVVAPYVFLYQNGYYKGTSLNSESLVGANSALASVAKLELQQGRFVSNLDRSGLFCVVGSDIAAQLTSLGVKKIIGNQIRIGKSYFTIVGILKPWSPNFYFYTEVNKAIIIPIQTSFLLSKYAQISSMLIRFEKDANLDDVKNALTNIMAQLIPTQTISFRTPQKIIDIVKNQKKSQDQELIFVGFVALVVGAIGVMNIMLVSVVERRREIGIRMAIGAQGYDILLMFLIESVVLTVFGGILGIIIGLALPYSFAYMHGWALSFYLLPPLLGFVVSVAVGVLSGFYPAWRASRLDPIETLQSD